jgi:hypothetical protein
LYTVAPYDDMERAAFRVAHTKRKSVLSLISV